MITRWTHPLLGTLLALGFASAAHAAAPATPQGMITGKGFFSIGGTTIANLTNSAKFPDHPDAIFTFPYFEWNATGDIFTPAGEYANDYGGQIVGYFYPPSTGDYYFYISADDNAVLYLSTDATAANKKLIAQETAYSGVRQYLESSGSSNLASKDSSQFAGTEWPTRDEIMGGARITLQASQPYYIEALFKEGGGGDFLSVAVLDPGYTIDSSLPIPGEYLATDRTVGPAIIARQPSNQSAAERGSVTFGVLPDGTPPYSFQWRKSGTDIPNATNMTYTVTGATMADHNATYSVVVTGAAGSVTSANATLTVEPDTTVPQLLSAKGSPSLTEVVLVFSEPIDTATGETVANYQISTSGGTLAVTGAEVSPSGTTVTLTTAQQTLGTKYTVQASGLRDTAATPNTLAPNSSAIFFPSGKIVEMAGMIVIEAENYDRNTDGLWVRDTTRGTPSGGASMVAPNGSGANEQSKIEYDVEFAQTGTYQVWILASGDNGNDDSVWFHIDEDDDGITERPFDRSAGNGASMTGFQPQANFVWRSDSQDGPDPFTIEIYATGPRAIALANREDGSFIDKILLTTNLSYTPTGMGPPETRQGAPGLPTVAVTGLTTGQTFQSGANINLAVNAAGQSGLNITRIEYSANGNVIGESSTSPYNFTWTAPPVGIYAIRANAIDEMGQSTLSESVVVTVEAAGQTAPRIAWVSFHAADDAPSAAAAAAGLTNASDVAYTRLLRDNGYEVTRVLTTGTPTADLLNAYDLVIISRAVPSGDYETAAETAAWHGISAPMMILGGYVIRDNRLGLMTGNTIPDTIGPIRLTVNDKNHPIFEGISLDANDTMVNVYANPTTFNTTTNRGVSVVTDPVQGNGTVLATVGTAEDGTFGGMIIGEWKAGDEVNLDLATGVAQTLAGDRLVFLTGSREYDGLTSEGAGMFDLAPDGAQLFLNAVTYLAGEGSSGPGPQPTLAVSRTATGLSLTFTGTLQSSSNVLEGWADVAGATSPHNIPADQGARFFRARN